VYDKLARQCAAEGLDHIRFLLRLAELELIDRERRMLPPPEPSATCWLERNPCDWPQ
jgi:hypothetical protein